MSELIVPDDLTNRIESRIEHTEFESPDEYAEFVLSEVLARVEHESTDGRSQAASREEIQTRLQSLGYLED